MIPKVAKSGHSFKGAAAYYLHDKTQDNDFNQASGARAQTAERVEWTETRNLATDNPETAWKVMSATAMNADNLKAQNRESEGKRTQASGQTNAKNVYAYSLAWSPEEQGNITREEMTTAAEDTLERLGFQDHQAMFICHNDTDHPHVHVLVNKVNPETGKTHNPHRDFNKLDKWANEYRKDRGEEHYCPNRAKKWENHDEGKSNKNREKQTNTRLDSDQHKTMSADDPRAAKVRKENAKLGNRISDIGKRMKQSHGEQWETFKAKSKTDRADIWEKYKAPMQSAKKWQELAYKSKQDVYARYSDPMKRAQDRLANAKFAKDAFYSKFDKIHAREKEIIGAKFKGIRSQLGKKHWKDNRAWESREQTMTGRVMNAISAARFYRTTAHSQGFLKDTSRMMKSKEQRAVALVTLQNIAFDKIGKIQQAELGAKRKEVNQVRKAELDPSMSAYNDARNEISQLFQNRKAELDPLNKTYTDAKVEMKQLFNHRKGELAVQRLSSDEGYSSLKTTQASKRQQLQRVWGKLKTRRAKTLTRLSTQIKTKAEQRHAHNQSLNARFKDKAEEEATTKTRNRNRSKERKPRSRGRSYRHKPE